MVGTVAILPGETAARSSRHLAAIYGVHPTISIRPKHLVSFEGGHLVVKSRSKFQTLVRCWPKDENRVKTQY